ncbi:head maturation protease, ClpP-related [Butyribacter intestini]|uniref:head maturation protease, ClpP-related n=1 Tax=Butyribacter intestini TaxID=1703332 RepID=UPI003AF1D335
MSVLKLKKTDRKSNRIRDCGSIEIKNQTDNEAEICFYGDINSDSMGEWSKYFPDDKCPSDIKEFFDQLSDDVEKIHVHINSGGGSVFGGIAIYNLLKNHKAEIIVHVDALAASIASVIAMAGDKIIIPKNAQLMIHKPMALVSGNADEMRKEADVLDGCQKVILSTYMDHVKEGVTEKTINDLINAETWLNGEECQEYFNFDVEDSNEAVAAVSEYFDKYNNLPEKLKELTGENKADDWQKDFAQWCKKSVKELENINKKIDNINEKDDIAVSAEKQKREHDDRVAAILNDLAYL